MTTKILIFSSSFSPNVGGVETVMSVLAGEFVALGHEVKVITKTPAADPDVFPFQVIRDPTPRQFFDVIRWCEMYLSGCISLKALWPLAWFRRPVVFTHHTWYLRSNGTSALQDRLKRFLTRFAENISNSHAIAAHLPVRSAVIPNPYRDDIFRQMPEIPRNKELIYVGRLVSDKGVDLLIEALARLKDMGATPRLTIIGSGPDELKLRHQAKALNVMDQVDFVGVKAGQALAEHLNAHRIMVIPSRWEEPFGIVAIEGIACGCVVVGSEGGGLKQAINSCGSTFPNGNIQALTQILSDTLSDTNGLVHYQKNAKAHLARHKKDIIARSYLDIFETLLK